MTGDVPPTASSDAPPARRSAGDLDRHPVLVVPGLNDSGPGHWQTRWLEAHRRFRRVVQPDSATPDLNRWAATVATAIDGCGAPPIVVAHSYGCLAAVRAGFLFERRIAGALLVAPADPDRFGALHRLPARPLPYPSILVASSDDPVIRLTKAGLLATRWGSRLVAVPNAGHINLESGHGPWPLGLRLLRDLAALVADEAGVDGSAPPRQPRATAAMAAPPLPQPPAGGGERQPRRVAAA